MTNVGHSAPHGSRRRAYRHCKRLLARLAARSWRGPRGSIEPVVRRFLAGRTRGYLLRLAHDRPFALAAVAALLAAAQAGALPPVDLSDVALGIGGYVMNGIDAGDYSGISISGAGDVNGDGLDDVIVGADGADPAGNSSAGESYVIFGAADGSPMDLAAVAAGTGGFVIRGADPFDFAGNSVSGAGDVNGDGLDDVIVGAWGADPAGNSSAGESYVVFGKADGIPVDLSAVASGNGGFVMNGIDSNDLSGAGVSGAGDVNGDGLDDVIVGAWFADPGGNNLAGESYVVFGKADGSPVSLAAVAAGNGGFVIYGTDPIDEAGNSVSGAGDVNGDGLDDVIVGAWLAAPGGHTFAGESSVVFGKADGTPVNLSDVAAGTGGFVINGIDLGDRSGSGVSGARDVNGDGLDDVVVGARYADPAGNNAAGESYVVFGKADGTPVDLSAVTAGLGGFVINGIDPDDQSGTSVSGAGDVNGDGLDDVIVGARHADPDGNSSAGESYVIFGKADGSAVDLSSVAAGIGGFVINGVDPNDLSGNSVSGAGDVNGDGLDDVIIGTFMFGTDAPGECYVVFGKMDGTPVNLSSVAAGTGGFVINGINPDDDAGRSVSGAGDVNGDGLDDLIVGAASADPGYGGAGESYVVFGKDGGSPVDLSTVASGTGGFVIKGIRFGDGSGTSVSGAGDVNGDGADDVIVGASGADPAGNSSAGESYVVFSPFCPWDCDGSGDGIVNVSDLLALLAQFDPMSPANCTGGSCDYDNDGCVDVADLLDLLGHYNTPGVGCP